MKNNGKTPERTISEIIRFEIENAQNPADLKNAIEKIAGKIKGSRNFSLEEKEEFLDTLILTLIRLDKEHQETQRLFDKEEERRIVAEEELGYFLDLVRLVLEEPDLSKQSRKLQALYRALEKDKEYDKLQLQRIILMTS